MILLLLSLLFLVGASIKKPIYGLMVYMTIRLCLPSSIRVFNFSYNTMAFLLMFVFVAPHCIRRYKKIDVWQIRFIKTLVWFVGGLLTLSVISAFIGVVPWPYQLSKLTQMVYTELLPAIFLVVLLDSKYVNLFNKVLACCACFSLLYAVFTFVSQTNPFYEMFYSDEEDMLEAAANSRVGMLEGVAVGIYNNKISMSLISMLYFIYFFNKIQMARFLIGGVVLLAFIVTILTSQRSAILAEMIFAAYMLLKSKVDIRKFLVLSLLIGVVGVFASLYFEQFENFRNVLKSTLLVFDDKAQQDLGIGGSTMELRMQQFSAVFEFVKYYLLQGMGYGFTAYFYEVIWDVKVYGLRDDVAGFESILLQIMASSGIIGLYVWWKMFQGLRKIQISKCVKSLQKYHVDAFMFAYLFAVILTDVSGSEFLFFLFCAMNIYCTLFLTIYNDRKVKLNKQEDII